MEKLAPKEWKAYADFVAQKMNEKKAGSFEKAIDRRMELYGRSENTRLSSRDDARREVIADSTRALFEDKNFPKELAQHDVSLARKIADILKKIIAQIKQVFDHNNLREAQRQEFSALWNNLDTLQELRDRFIAAAKAQAENATSGMGGTQYEIREGMTDKERYEELKDKTIPAFEYNQKLINEQTPGEKSRVATGKERIARKDLKAFAQKAGVLKKTYDRNDLGMSFTYTINNYKESVSQQMNVQGNDRFERFVKMLSCLDNIVDKAVVIEKHVPKKDVEDSDLKMIHVMISSFKDGDDVVPVKLLVKEYNKKDNGLYVTIALDKINETALHDQSPEENRSLTISNYNIARLLKKVKENEGTGGQLGKYIPDMFLSEGNTEQKKTFSLREPVEQTKDLIAIHNFTEDKLLRTLKLGGFLMPSIAVTNLDHSNFGNISVLFGKETIDAGENKANKVYSADAWTPTVPSTEYEANYDVTRRAQDQIEELTSDNDYFNQMARGEFSHYNAEQLLNRTGGLKGYIDRLMDNAGVKYAYLKSKGEEVQIEQKKVPPKYDPKDEAKYIQLLHAVDYHPEELKGTGHELINDERLKKVAADLGYELGSTSIFKGNRGFVRLVRSAYRYATETETNELENDYNATGRAMDERIDKEDMQHWLEKMLDGIVANEGIWNGKDPFTSAGNSRSFNQLHYPVTAENIVRAMKAQGDKNVAVTHGIKPLRAELAKTFKNVDDIRKNKEYIEGQINDALADDRMLFMDKKRSHIVAGGTSFQLARRRNFDFKDNINDFWAEVNYEEWQKNNKGQYSLRESSEDYDVENAKLREKVSGE